MITSRRSLLGFRFGTVKATQETPTIRTMQVRLSDLETHDGAVLVQHYGIASRPKPKCTALVVTVGGEQSPQDVVIATTDARYHLTLAEGEAALHDDLGRFIKIARSGIVINGNGSATTVTGDLHVSGAVVAGYGGGDAVSLQTHRHGTGTAAAGTSAPTAGT